LTVERYTFDSLGFQIATVEKVSCRGLARLQPPIQIVLGREKRMAKTEIINIAFGCRQSLLLLFSGNEVYSYWLTRYRLASASQAVWHKNLIYSGNVLSVLLAPFKTHSELGFIDPFYPFKSVTFLTQYDETLLVITVIAVISTLDTATSTVTVSHISYFLMFSSWLLWAWLWLVLETLDCSLVRLCSASNTRSYLQILH
jgi:hypothetical protein